MEAIKNVIRAKTSHMGAMGIICREIIPCARSTKSYKLYNIARRKILQELDVSNVLKQIRMARIMTHL